MIKVDARMVNARSRAQSRTVQMQGESDWKMTSAEVLLESDSFWKAFMNIVDLVVFFWNKFVTSV